MEVGGENIGTVGIAPPITAPPLKEVGGEVDATQRIVFMVCMLYLQNWRLYKHANLLSHFSACTEMGK